MRTQSRQQLKFQALLAALVPPWVESSESPRVLALLGARGTPKHVLTSCAGLIKASRLGVAAGRVVPGVLCARLRLCVPLKHSTKMAYCDQQSR
jgi:hypothetical protein